MTFRVHTLIQRKRGKSLGLPELIAIALGGMIGGGIFSILGIAVSMTGVFAPLAIGIGGMIAFLAAYSYVKLGVYYRDEGATYSFCKKTFLQSPFFASLIGWWVVFGYISTVALYAYTFAAYLVSASPVADSEWVRKAVAGIVIFVFTLINVWSVRGMGKIEDLMVYTKLTILFVIAFVLLNSSNTTIPVLLQNNQDVDHSTILIVAFVTFVSYEGFQLVINAVNEMEKPEINIPRAIYSALFLTTLLYVVISLGAILSIPFAEIIQKKEYALAAGMENMLWGTGLVISGALLATSSAINATIFGASRQMAVIATDGYFPGFLARRINRIPVYSIICISVLAFALVLSATLEDILELGSLTFLLVSALMAYANFSIRHLTQASLFLTLVSVFGLVAGTGVIFYYKFTTDPYQMFFVVGIYFLLTLGSWFYFRRTL